MSKLSISGEDIPLFLNKWMVKIL